MKHFFTLLGDLLFYAFTHALSENWLDSLAWTIKPSTRLITAAAASPRTSRSGFGRSTLNNSVIAGKVCD